MIRSKLMKTISKITEMPIYKQGTIQTVYRDGQYVYKVIDSSKYGCSTNQIACDISSYYNQCKRAGVCVPRYAKIPYLVGGKVVVNKYSYEGKPLLDSLKENSFKIAYRSYLQSLKNGLFAKVALSSFHEQFTFNGKNAVFVDFFIPASRKGFLHYKKNKNACNYFLVQFSYDSSFLSAMTQFINLLPEKNEEIIEEFNSFLNKNKQYFPLASKTIKLKQFDWAVNNLSKLLVSNSKWLTIGNDYQLSCYDSPRKLLKNSSNEDLILNLKRQRFFCRQELVRSVKRYKKQHA